MGRLDKIEDLVKSLNSFEQPGLLAEYALAGYAAKKKDWTSFRAILKQKKKHPVDELLKPLLLAWSFVAEEKSDEAYQTLEPLKAKAEFVPYYAYHKGLIGLLLKNDTAAKEGFSLLATNSLIVMSYLPEIQAFYAVRNAWNLDNPMFVQTQILQSKQPATVELMRSYPVRPMTPLLGMAAQRFLCLSMYTMVGLSLMPMRA